MANHWLRLWHDMPNDPKWRTIARASGQSIALVQAVYLHLLVDASRNVTRGHVTVTHEDLASALDVTEGDIAAVLTAMQGRVLDGDQVSGWGARQPKNNDDGDPKTGAKSAAQRKRDQRERERQEKEFGACHDQSRGVTTDKDKDKEEKELQQQQRPQPTIDIDARQRFEMFEGWVPDEVSLAPHLRMIGVAVERVTPEALAEFVSFWLTRPDTANNQAGWCRALVTSIKQAGVRAAASPAARTGRTSQHTQLATQDPTAGLEANPDGTYAL